MHDRLHPTSMTLLLNKIERRLGTINLNLPDHLKKDKWGEIIIHDSLPTFSRYFPHRIEYTVCCKTDRIGDSKWFRIFPSRISEGHVTVLGIQDVNRNSMYKTTIQSRLGSVGQIMPAMYNLTDIAFTQMQADIASLYDTNIYPQYEHPDKIAIVNSAGFDISGNMEMFDVYLLIEHPESLATISPTIYEYFEKLCKLDVENTLYQELRYFDKMETINGTNDLKIEEWANASSERDALIEEIKDKYVSFANQFQPMMITI